MRRRWSDNEKRWGPFTYSRDVYGVQWSIVLDSGEEEYTGCCLRIRGFGHTLIVELPPLIQPYREKHLAHSWDAATVARLGRDWYFEEHRREYGLSLSDGFLNVYLGRQTDDSSTEQRWSWFLPWRQWRFHRHSIYGLQGEHIATLLEVPRRSTFEETRALEEACPKAVFRILDYDGEPIAVTTFIEERAWLFGTGRFKWLSAFRRPRVNRSLSIRFSAEVGPEKGSWKGGTLGHGIEMRPGELHLGAFGRYCAEHKLTLLMPVAA